MGNNRRRLTGHAWLAEPEIRALTLSERAIYMDLVSMCSLGKVPPDTAGICRALCAINRGQTRERSRKRYTQVLASLRTCHLLCNGDGVLRTAHVIPDGHCTSNRGDAADTLPGQPNPDLDLEQDLLPNRSAKGKTSKEQTARDPQHVRQYLTDTFGACPTGRLFTQVVAQLCDAGRSNEIIAAAQRVTAAMVRPEAKRPKDALSYLARAILALAAGKGATK